MAAAGTTRRHTTKAAAPKPKPAPEPAVEEFEEDEVDTELEGSDDDELEVDEEADEVAETKPASKKASAAEAVTFGIRDLIALIKEKTGQDTDPRGLRTLIRKMARDGSGRVDREILPGNRARYDWSGPNDPEVVAIVQAFKNGELEAEKKAKLDELKQRKAAKTAAAKEAEVEEADDEDEKPARRTRTTAAKKTAPARRTRKPAPAPEVVEDDEELDLDDDE